MVSENLNQQLQSEEQIQPTNQGGQQPTSQPTQQEQPKKEFEPTVAAAMYLLNNDSTRDAVSKYSTDPDELARLLKSDPKLRQEVVKLTNTPYDSFIQKINIDKGLDEFQKKKGINITPADTAIRTASIYNVPGRNTPTDPITKEKNYSLVDADVSWLPIASGLSSRGDNNDGRAAFVLESDSESNDKETVIYTNDPQFVNIASPGFNFKDSKNPNIEPYTYPDGTVGEVYKIKVPKDFNQKDIIKGELLNQGFNTSMSSRKGLDQSDLSTYDVFRGSMEKLTGNEITTVFELREDLNRLKNLYQKGPEAKGDAWKKANEEERKRIGEEIKRREAYLESFEKKYYNLDALGVTQDDDYEAVFRKTVAQEEKLGDQSFATYLSNLENLGTNIEKEGRSTLDKLLTGGYAIELIEGLGDDEISQYALATAQKGKIGYFYQRLSDSVSSSLQRVKEEFGEDVHDIVLRGVRGETTDEDLQIIESGQLPVNEAFQYLNNDSKGALGKMSEMAGKIEDIDKMYPKARKIDSDLLKEGIKKDKLGESIGYLGRGALSFGGAVLNIAPSFLGSIQSTVRSAVVGTFNPEKARDLATLGQLVENLNDGFIDFTQNSFNTRELGETVSSGTDSNGVFYEVTYDNEMKPKNVYQNGKRVIFNSSDEQEALIERLQASETIGLPEYQRNTESIIKAGFNSAGDLINTFAFTGGASAILKGTASAAKINSASRFGKVLTSDTAALIAGLNVQYGGRQIEEYINAGVNPRMAILLGLSKSTTEGAIASIFPDFELGRFGLGVSKSSLIRSLSNKSLTSTQKFMEVSKATTRAVGKQLSQEVPEEVLADVITNAQDNLVRSLSEGKVDVGGKIDPLVTAATTIVSVGLTSVGGNLLKNKNISQSTLYTQALRDAALDPRRFGDILATQVAEGQLTEAEAESIQTRLNNLNESVRDVLLDKNGKERSDIPENVKLALIRSADLKNLADNTSEDLSGIPQDFDVLGESAVREAESTVIKQAIEQGKAKELGDYLNKHSTVLGFDEGSPLRSLVHLQNSFKTYSQRVNELKKSLETGIEGTSNARIKKALNRAESLQQYYEILMRASEAGNLVIGEDNKGSVKGIKVTTNAEGKNIVKLEGTDEEIQISDETKELFALGSNEVLRQIKNDLEALTAREIIENDDDIEAEEKVVKDNSLGDAPESGSVRTTLPGKKVEGNFVKEGGRWYIKDNEGGLHPVSVKNFRELDQALLDSKKKPADKVEEMPKATTEEMAEGVAEGITEGITEEAPTVATEEVTEEMPTEAPTVATEEAPTEITAETTENVLYETPRQRVIEKDGQRVAQHKKGDEWVDYKNQDGIAATSLFNNVPEQVAETDAEVEAETPTEAKSEARQIKEKVQEEGGDQKQLIEELAKSDAIPSVSVTSMNVDDITVDPERFQFKIGLDPETGVSDALKSVSKFDKRKANVISVWKDPKDGKTYVINGHHRLDLAKRKGVKTINVMVLNEETESQARYVGAMQNLSEGMGSATDAAKMFRESGITELEQALPLLETEGLATTDNKVQTAISLAALSEPLFDLVVKGEISENVGAVIGRHIKSKPIQEQFYREQVRGKRTNLRDLKIMAQDVEAAPKETVVELSLFGETETEKAAYRDRVSVISGVRASIGKAKNLLKKVAKDSDFLAEFGNKIDAEKSEGAANDAAIALAIFDSLRNTNPEIKKIIDDATKRIQDGETKSRAIAKAAREIQNSLERIYDGSFGKGTTTRSDQPKSDESEATTEVTVPVEASIPESEKKEIAERIGEVRKVKAKNLKGLLDVMSSVFGLNKEQAESAAVIGDVLVETMAKRAGISKEAMYARIAFQKSSMEELAKLSSKGKQLFQIVGENAQLGETIKENLQVARDMETSGKDAKTIRMATGWEKGKDGKWRYEILDGELKGRAKKDTDEGYSSNFGRNLESVLENEELFKAYPSLRKIKVEFKDGNNTGSFSGGKITVSSNANNKKSILLHEIQHAIQDIEGFAKGGSAKNVQADISLAIIMLKDDLDLAQKEFRPVDKNKSEFSEKFYNQKKKQVDDLKDSIQKLEDIRYDESLTAHDKYKALAGEVEARNVQSRMGMTPEQRRATTLQETEDVARDEQIVLFQALEEYVGWHRAPKKEGKNSLDDMSDVFPSDLYSQRGVTFYGDTGGRSLSDRESYKAIVDAKGKPDKMVTVYRAVPKGVKTINNGDWVTLSRNYAKEHGNSHLDGYDIISTKVKASDLFNEGSINEFGVAIQENNPVFQQNDLAARGAMMQIMDNKAILFALTDPNVSTPLHELAHVYEHYLTDAERQTIIKNAGTEGWTVETSEYFARGFEKYLSEGVAPTPALQKAFDNFKNWLTEIYNGIIGSDIDVDLNDEMRGIYEQMLGKDAVKPAIQPTIYGTGTQAPLFQRASKERVTKNSKVSVKGKDGVWVARNIVIDGKDGRVRIQSVDNPSVVETVPFSDILGLAKTPEIVEALKSNANRSNSVYDKLKLPDAKSNPKVGDIIAYEGKDYLVTKVDGDKITIKSDEGSVRINYKTNLKYDGVIAKPKTPEQRVADTLTFDVEVDTLTEATGRAANNILSLIAEVGDVNLLLESETVKRLGLQDFVRQVNDIFNNREAGIDDSKERANQAIDEAYQAMEKELEAVDRQYGTDEELEVSIENEFGDTEIVSVGEIKDRIYDKYQMIRDAAFGMLNESVIIHDGARLVIPKDKGIKFDGETQPPMTGTFIFRKTDLDSDQGTWFSLSEDGKERKVTKSNPAKQYALSSAYKNINGLKIPKNAEVSYNGDNYELIRGVWMLRQEVGGKLVYSKLPNDVFGNMLTSLYKAENEATTSDSVSEILEGLDADALQSIEEILAELNEETDGSQEIREAAMNPEDSGRPDKPNETEWFRLGIDLAAALNQFGGAAKVIFASHSTESDFKRSWLRYNNEVRLQRGTKPVTEKDYSSAYRKGFVEVTKDGYIVHMNPNMADAKSVMHEFAHIPVISLMADNPDVPLALVEFLKPYLPKEIRQKVETFLEKGKYDASTDFEYLAQLAAELASANMRVQYSVGKKIMEFFSEMFNQVMDMFRSVINFSKDKKGSLPNNFDVSKERAKDFARTNGIDFINAVVETLVNRRPTSLNGQMNIDPNYEFKSKFGFSIESRMSKDSPKAIFVAKIYQRMMQDAKEALRKSNKDPQALSIGKYIPLINASGLGLTLASLELIKAKVVRDMDTSMGRVVQTQGMPKMRVSNHSLKEVLLFQGINPSLIDTSPELKQYEEDFAAAIMEGLNTDTGLAMISNKVSNGETLSAKEMIALGSAVFSLNKELDMAKANLEKTVGKEERANAREDVRRLEDGLVNLFLTYKKAGTLAARSLGIRGALFKNAFLENPVVHMEEFLRANGISRGSVSNKSMEALRKAVEDYRSVVDEINKLDLRKTRNKQLRDAAIAVLKEETTMLPGEAQFIRDAIAENIDVMGEDNTEAAIRGAIYNFIANKEMKGKLAYNEIAKVISDFTGVDLDTALNSVYSVAAVPLKDQVIEASKKAEGNKSALNSISKLLESSYDKLDRGLPLEENKLINLKAIIDNMDAFSKKDKNLMKAHIDAILSYDPPTDIPMTKGETESMSAITGVTAKERSEIKTLMDNIKQAQSNIDALIEAKNRNDIPALIRLGVKFNKTPKTAADFVKAELQDRLRQKRNAQRVIEDKIIREHETRTLKGSIFYYGKKFLAYPGIKLVASLDASFVGLQALKPTATLFGSALTAPLSKSRRGDGRVINRKLAHNFYNSLRTLGKGLYSGLFTKGASNDAILSDVVKQYERFENEPIHWKRVLAGLEISNPAQYGSSEEMFSSSNWLDEVYGIGAITTSSQASMDMYLNEVRVMMFDAFAQNVNDPVQLQAYAEIVNTSTGRTKMKGSKTASALFFAPRLYVSQIRTALGYDAYKTFYDADKKGAVGNELKKQFFKDLTHRWMGYATLALGMSLLGFKINFDLDDPRNMFRWTKEKVDGTTFTIDTPGGLPFYYRTAFAVAKVLSEGADAASTTDIFDVIIRDIRKKINPGVGAALSFFNNKDFLGRPIGLSFQERAITALAMAFTPIPIQEPVIDGLRSTLSAMSDKDVVSNYIGVNTDNMQEDFTDGLGRYVLSSLGVNSYESSPAGSFAYRAYLHKNKITPRLDYTKLLEGKKSAKLFRTTIKKFGQEADDYSKMKDLYRRQVLDEVSRIMKRKYYRNGKYVFEKSDFNQVLREVSEKHINTWERKYRSLN